MLLLRDLNSAPVNNSRVMPGLAQSHLAQESEPATRTSLPLRPASSKGWAGTALNNIIFIYLLF